MATGGGASDVLADLYPVGACTSMTRARARMSVFGQHHGLMY